MIRGTGNKLLDIVYVIVGAVIGAVGLWGWTHSSVTGSVLRVTEQVPFRDVIKVGDPFVIDLTVDKFRDDCTQGRITRHMYGVNTGIWYRIAERSAFQLPVGTHPFHLEIPTKPLEHDKDHLVVPGLWEIRTLISYECPTSPGRWETVEYKFNTPTFEMVEQ